MQETWAYPWVRKIPWRRKWQPAPVFLPGKSHGQRSLVGHSSWGHEELDMIKHTHTQNLSNLADPFSQLFWILIWSCDLFSFWPMAFGVVLGVPPLSSPSVSQFSHSVVSDSLRPHESQHFRPPCPSPTPGVHSNSRPSSR